MGNFPGGSAWAMAKDVAEGYLLVTDRTFARLQPGELEQLAFEIDRALRDVRGDQPALDDQPALLARNRKITRLNQCLSMLRAHQQRRRPGTTPSPGPAGPKGAKGGPANKGPARARAGLSELLRQAGPALLAVAAVAGFDLRTRRAGLDPPAFGDPARRLAGGAALAAVLWVGVFAALGRAGGGGEVDFARLPTWQLFLVHLMLASGILAWWGAGFAGVAPGRSLAEQLGLAAERPWRAVGVGVVFGLGAWFVVLAGVVAIALAVAALGGEEHLPQRPPAVIPWLAGQPFGLRLGLALSAGVVEELFFRGLLQPRTGIAFSTLLFALAHVSYDQPFLLVGVTLLSVLYGLLVRWRQSVWAAITAHALFDAVQLLVVIPVVLERFYGGPR